MQHAEQVLKERPNMITLATVTMATFLTLGVAAWVPRVPLAVGIAFIAFALVAGAMLFSFWKGANWMRWVVMLVTVLSAMPAAAMQAVLLIGAGTGIGTGSEPYGLPYAVLVFTEAGFGLYMLYALNTARARTYFLGRKSTSALEAALTELRDLDSSVKVVLVVALAGASLLTSVILFLVFG